MTLLPQRDGVGASTLTVTAGPWTTLLQLLVARFPQVSAEQWHSRFERGLIVNDGGTALAPAQPPVPGERLHYWRELPPEPTIPFEATVLHRDGQLLVIDKPHFLPVIPTGRFVQQCLLVRLRHEPGLEQIAPIHRLDRGTAGLILFSIRPETRGRYQQLFAQRAVEKIYEALAPAQMELSQPLIRRSRLVRGEPFFRSCEVAGEPNAETRVEPMETRGELALYRLAPLTGRKHQLRVHMAALGAPIVNDPLYPELRPEVADDDFSRPLKLLARSLEFDDPLTGERRAFRSLRSL